MLIPQVVPGPRRGGSLENRTRATGNQWPMWKFLRCRSNDVLKLCEVHQRMSKWLLRCQWNDMKESVHNWVSELMNKWIDKPRNQWTSQSMTQRITEATKQWLNESSNQWTNESMSQWIKDSMNQWLHDSESQWITESPESVNQGSNESMNEAIQSNSSSNSDLYPFSFVEWGFFSTKQILWNAHVALATVWCTFCRPHLPKVCRSLQCFLRFLCETELSLQSRAHFADVIFQKWSFAGLIFQKCSFWSGNRARATVLGAFCQPLSQIEPRNCGNRDPTATTTEATSPRKTQGFTPESVCTREFARRLNCYTSQLLDDGWLTWWCVWHDDGNANHDAHITRKFSN